MGRWRGTDNGEQHASPLCKHSSTESLPSIETAFKDVGFLQSNQGMVHRELGRNETKVRATKNMATATSAGVGMWAGRGNAVGGRSISGSSVPANRAKQNNIKNQTKSLILLR